MSDLNQELDYDWVRHSMVMATKWIILTDGEVDIFVSLVLFSHSFWSKLGDFSWNDKLSVWTLVCKSR